MWKHLRHQNIVLHRRYTRSFAIRIRVDAEWNSNRISQSQPECGPGRPGEFFPGLLLC